MDLRIILGLHLDLSPLEKCKQINKQINKWACIKFKRFYVVKAIWNKIKRQTLGGQNIYTAGMKGLIFKIQKSLIKSSSKLFFFSK